MSRATSTPRVFLVGYYGSDNLGDESILEAIEGAAVRLGVTIDRYATRLPVDDPRAVRLAFRSLGPYLRAIRRADRVVLGGGGLLKDESLQLPLELLLTAVVARVLRRDVTILAVGVGPIHTRLGRLVIAATARLASVRTVRDAESAALLGRLGVSNVETGADPIFTLPSPTATASPAAGDPTSAARARSATVSLRPWFLGSGADREDRRRAFRAAVATGLGPLVEAGWTLRLVALYWPRDRDEAQRLVDEAGWADRVEVVDARLTWDALLASLAVADLVVAMRYHALAGAAIAGRPVIALAYEPKVAALASELRVPTLDVDDPNLGERLAELTRSEPVTADAAALDDLRRRAWRAVGLALTRRAADPPS